MVKGIKRGDRREMENKAITLSLSILTGLISSYFEAYGVIFVFVCLAIIFDVITGLVASVANGVAITSGKARKGFWKKICLLLALLLGIFMDAFLPQLLLVVNIQLERNLPFGLIIGCYIILNELISIAENIVSTNSIAMPTWIIKWLKGAKKEIDEIEEKKDEQN